VQPFTVVPLLSYNNRAIGVIHVGLKNTTSYNQHGFYVGVDEQLLVSFQREIIAFYEQWRFRATTEFAVQDLHDALSLVTYDLLYGLDHAQQELELEDTLSAAARLQDIEYTAQSLVREIRGIMVGLKSHVLENMGLVKALKHFIDTSVRRPGLMVDFISEEPSTWLSNKSAWQIYRIAQEALTNVIKHAAADHIMCRVDITETEITLYISDNGRGFDVLSREIVRHGLTNMRKRAEKALGGEFDVQSKPGEGTTVTVKVPRGGWYATTID
jgi:signal transduction histidine kinase